MTGRTWIDVASDWVVYRFSITSSQSAETFSPQQVAILRQAFEKSSLAFAEQVDARFATLEQMSKLPQASSETSGVFCSAEATSIREATSSDAARVGKNRTRAVRRRNAKTKFLYSRTQLLSVMHRTQLDEYKEASVNGELPMRSICTQLGNGESDMLMRLANVEALVLDFQNSCNAFVPEQWDRSDGVIMRGVSANILSKQCRSARFIQAYWRFGKWKKKHTCDNDFWTDMSAYDDLARAFRDSEEV